MCWRRTWGRGVDDVMNSYSVGYLESTSSLRRFDFEGAVAVLPR